VSEENIKKIKKFFLNKLNIEETQIIEHTNHDLMIRHSQLAEWVYNENIYIIRISFKCIDCKEIWEHPIRGNKIYIIRLYGEIGFFLSQQDDITRLESEGYRIIKNIKKNYKDEDLDNLEISSGGNNKKLEIYFKRNYELCEEGENLNIICRLI